MALHLPLPSVDRSKYVTNTKTYESSLFFNSISSNEVCLRMKDKRLIFSLTNQYSNIYFRTISKIYDS